MGQLEEAAVKVFAEVTKLAQRDVISEPFGSPQHSAIQLQSFFRANHPAVVFLDSPKEVIDNPELECPESAAKRPPSVSASESLTTDTAVTKRRQTEPDIAEKHVTMQPPFANLSDSEIGQKSDSESRRCAGSALAEALHPAAGESLPETSDLVSNVTPDHLPAEPRILPSGGRIRALIREYFTENESFRLSPGHPTIVFTEGQISNVLRVVADETARVSYDMLENLIHRANRLSLTSVPIGSGNNKKGSTRRESFVVTSEGRYQDSSSGGCSDTSGALQNDDDFASIGYS